MAQGVSRPPQNIVISVKGLNDIGIADKEVAGMRLKERLIGPACDCGESQQIAGALQNCALAQLYITITPDAPKILTPTRAARKNIIISFLLRMYACTVRDFECVKGFSLSLIVMGLA